MTRDVPCCFCGATARSSYLEENGYALVRCQRCGALFVSPRPAGVPGPLDSGYRSDRPERFDRRRRDWVAEVLTDLSGPMRANASWLDLSAGAGEVLEAVGDIFGPGVTALGVEPDMRLAAVARRRELDVAYFRLDQHGARYDAISAFDLLGRLPDPRAALAEWVSLLHPGGVLFLQTTDTAHLPSFDHPRPLDLPRQLSFPSEAIVTGLLSDVGLRVEQVTRRPLVQWGLSTWVRELAATALPGRRSRLGTQEQSSRMLSVIVKARFGRSDRGT